MLIAREGSTLPWTGPETRWRSRVVQGMVRRDQKPERVTQQSTGQALSERHRPAHAGRTAQSHAAFLLPHLRPGQDLLDLGCGPGTITTGLAAAVAPGRTVGVDIASDLPESTDEVTFEPGDACALPYPDASFDAIYSSAVLQHLAEPLVAVREARRVARPGAVIGLADADWGGFLLAPHDPVLMDSFSLMEKLRTGSPRVGRDLRGLLAEAGFVRTQAFARTVHHGTTDEVRGFAAFNAAWFANPAIVETVVRQGWSSAEDMASATDAWARWGEQPGAFFAGFWCEALGWAD